MKRPPSEFANRVPLFADSEEAGYAFGSNPPYALTQDVVPAKAGTHMWTAPWLQEFVRVNPIACDHMSGLLSRSHMTAAKMGSATRGPNNQTASFANGSHGLSRVLGSIDHTHLLEQARPPACGVSRVPNSVIRSISWRSCWAPSLVE